MSASYPPDVILKNFVDTYLQSYTATYSIYPSVNDIADLIYFGSDYPGYTGGETVPGIAELITGQTPTDSSSLNLDLNNPRTHDDNTDNTPVDLHATLVSVINTIP